MFNYSKSSRLPFILYCRQLCGTYHAAEYSAKGRWSILSTPQYSISLLAREGKHPPRQNYMQVTHRTLPALRAGINSSKRLDLIRHVSWQCHTDLAQCMPAGVSRSLEAARLLALCCGDFTALRVHIRLPDAPSDLSHRRTRRVIDPSASRQRA